MTLSEASIDAADVLHTSLPYHPTATGTEGGEA
jgi:hypothetical protein